VRPPLQQFISCVSTAYSSSCAHSLCVRVPLGTVVSGTQERASFRWLMVGPPWLSSNRSVTREISCAQHHHTLSTSTSGSASLLCTRFGAMVSKLDPSLCIITLPFHSAHEFRAISRCISRGGSSRGKTRNVTRRDTKYLGSHVFGRQCMHFHWIPLGAGDSFAQSHASGGVQWRDSSRDATCREARWLVTSWTS
jgi:hypothetical protein